MVGIPRNLNTKRDVLNLQQMAKENLIDRKDWIKHLEDLKTEDTFNLPIIKREENCFFIPKTDRELPAEYKTRATVVSAEGVDGAGAERGNELIKIEGTTEAEFITVKAGHQEAKRLGIEVAEIEKMIEELV